MTFQDAVRTCLQVKFSDFSGRARRSEYWFFVLFNIILSVVANTLNSLLHLPKFGVLGGLLPLVVTLALLVPGIAVGVRRLHDTGRSGLWLLIAFVPILGAIALIVFMVQDSHPQPNTYGASPKAITSYA